MGKQQAGQVPQDIDSGKVVRRENPLSKDENRLEPGEASKIGKERRAVRFETGKSKLPISAWKIVESAPPAYQDRLIKALLGLASPKVSIRAKCEQCVGWEDTAARVGNCRSYSCALHFYRPYQKPT